MIGTAMTAGCFNHDGGLCGRPSSRERMKCHEAIPCVSTRDTISSNPQKSVKQALALAKDPKHPDETFLGPRSYIRGQTRDRTPRQGIAEITRHGSNGFLVGLENQRELVLAPPSRYTDEPRRHTLGAAPRSTILERFTFGRLAENLARIYPDSMAMT